MRTTKSSVTFLHPFKLNRDVEELAAGTYEIETDEDEILTSTRSAYRRTGVSFFVESRGSTRMLVIQPDDLESALTRDRAGGATSRTAEPLL